MIQTGQDLRYKLMLLNDRYDKFHVAFLYFLNFIKCFNDYRYEQRAVDIIFFIVLNGILFFWGLITIYNMT